MATQQEKSSNNLSNKPISNIMSPTSDPEEPSKKQNAVMEWLLGKLKVFVTSAFRMNSSVSLCSINILCSIVANTWYSKLNYLLTHAIREKRGKLYDRSDSKSNMG